MDNLFTLLGGTILSPVKSPSSRRVASWRKLHLIDVLLGVGRWDTVQW